MPDLLLILFSKLTRAWTSVLVVAVLAYVPFTIEQLSAVLTVAC